MPKNASAARKHAEPKLLELVKRWEDTYNDDVTAMIGECYAPTADVYFTGGEVHGKDQFLRLEKAILAAAPGRKMRVDRVHLAGEDKAIVEAVVLNDEDPAYFSPFCAILTVRDGKIVLDHTYLEPQRWPGIEAGAPHVTPGGLGKKRE